jgi:hypothetical protein
MTPENAVDKLGTLIEHLDGLRGQLSKEAEEICQQWQRLGRVGGRRADHAAVLLGRLRPELRALSQWAATCEQQIAEMAADPFGQKAETAARERRSARRACSDDGQ